MIVIQNFASWIFFTVAVWYWHVRHHCETQWNQSHILNDFQRKKTFISTITFYFRDKLFFFFIFFPQFYVFRVSFASFIFQSNLKNGPHSHTIVQRSNSFASTLMRMKGTKKRSIEKIRNTSHRKNIFVSSWHVWNYFCYGICQKRKGNDKKNVKLIKDLAKNNSKIIQIDGTLLFILATSTINSPVLWAQRSLFLDFKLFQIDFEYWFDWLCTMIVELSSQKFNKIDMN